MRSLFGCWTPTFCKLASRTQTSHLEKFCSFSSFDKNEEIFTLLQNSRYLNYQKNYFFQNKSINDSNQGSNSDTAPSWTNSNAQNMISNFAQNDLLREQETFRIIQLPSVPQISPAKKDGQLIILPGQRNVKIEDFRKQQDKIEIFDPISLEKSVVQEEGLWAGYRLEYNRPHNMLKIRRKKMKKHKHRKRLRKRRYQNRVIQSTGQLQRQKAEPKQDPGRAKTEKRGAKS